MKRIGVVFCCIVTFGWYFWYRVGRDIVETRGPFK